MRTLVVMMMIEVHSFLSCITARNMYISLVWFGLVSLFIQGKPLASGYYSRHPETTQYNKDKDKEKRKTEERTQKSKNTVAGENSKCSMQQLNIQVSVFIEMRVSQNNNMQLLLSSALSHINSNSDYVQEVFRVE